MSASPFGIEFFADFASLSVLGELEGGRLSISPPAPHPLFSSYSVSFSKNHGVVHILAISTPVQTDRFGHSLMALVDRISGQLSERYGDAEKEDFLLDGSVWNEPQDWKCGLEEGERFYNYCWEKTKGSNIPDVLDSIRLTALSDIEGGYAVLEYTSFQFANYLLEIESLQATLL